ncbi:DUF945 family protein [Salinisphaera sp. LB1]|uniref:DUF945 family protein n=1 Tax=Salinisphaera sp. LB1 TaxID=2183911 RepID=UPI000D7DE96F|nr:DUF945 family protein [Salinisphaera sp. LB1]AWN15212.1 hypothetical protein SALB1_1005 [Salinisphaera sp. LB1]
MRRLIKTLLWGLAALALLGVAAPYGVGWVLAARFDAVVAHLAVPGYLQVVRRTFDRGWFVSHATVVLRPIGPLCHAQPCPALALASRIDHGPLAWGATPVSLSPVLAVVETRADLTSLWPHYAFSPAPGPLTVTSHIRLDGRGRAHLSFTGMTFSVARRKPVAQVETATVSGALRFGWLARRIHGLSLDWPSFSLVRQSAGHIAWRHLHFQARAAPGGELANSRLTADSITLDNGHGHATRLSHLKLTTRCPAPGTTAVSLHIGKLVLPDSTQGAVILHARQHGLHPLAWAALPDRWRRLGGWSGGALDAPELYHDILPGLLPPGSQVQVGRFELATRDGAIRAGAHIQVPPDFKPSRDAAAALSQLQARLRLSLPRPILRRLLGRTLGATAGAPPEAAIDARVQALVARNLIAPSDDGQRYRMRLVLGDGRMRINGRNRPQWRALVGQFVAAAQGL